MNKSNEENYDIEDVDSDEEPRKRGLCIEKDNKIILDLSNRSKRKLNSTGDQDSSSKRRSLRSTENSDLDQSLYKNLSELINKYANESNTNDKLNNSSFRARKSHQSNHLLHSTPKGTVSLLYNQQLIYLPDFSLQQQVLN